VYHPYCYSVRVGLFFRFFNLPIRLIQQNSCCVGESTMNYQQNHMSSNLVEVIGSACLLIP
jgi:hypothetical protein